MEKNKYLVFFCASTLLAIPLSIFIVFLWQEIASVNVRFDIGRLAFLRTVVFITCLSMILTTFTLIARVNGDIDVMDLNRKALIYAVVAFVIGLNAFLIIGGNFVSMKLAPRQHIECVYWRSISANLDSELDGNLSIRAFDIIYVESQTDYQTYHVFNLNSPHQTNVQTYEVEPLHAFEDQLIYDTAHLTESHRFAKSHACQTLLSGESLKSNTVYLIQGNMNHSDLTVYAVREIPGYDMSLQLAEQSSDVKNLLENITRIPIE